MYYLALFIGLIIISVTTKIIQSFKLSNGYLLLSQISASLIIIMVSNLKVSHIKQFDLEYLTIPVSLLLLVGLTNVMNTEKEQKTLTL